MKRKNLTVATSQQMACTGAISAPASFKTASLAKLRSVCNGCGAATAKIDFVPDTIYGLYVGYVCNVHDWEYHVGMTEEDRNEADRRFRNNLIRVIDRACESNVFYRCIKRLMYARAYSYYLAVNRFGGPAFWNGKP